MLSCEGKYLLLNQTDRVESVNLPPLYALPPGSLITQCVEQGLPLAHATAVATAASKVKALAVEPDMRRHGIATSLLSGCTDLYERLGYFMQYGSFRAGSGLGAF